MFILDDIEKKQKKNLTMYIISSKETHSLNCLNRQRFWNASDGFY